MLLSSCIIFHRASHCWLPLLCTKQSTQRRGKKIIEFERQQQTYEVRHTAASYDYMQPALKVSRAFVFVFRPPTKTLVFESSTFFFILERE